MPISSPPPAPPQQPGKRPVHAPAQGSVTGTRPGAVSRPSSGQSAPAAAAPTTARTTPNRSVAALIGPVGRAVASLDNRIIRLATSAKAPAERKRAQLEVALLAHLRRGLAPYAEETRHGADDERIDTVLMETLLGGVEHALSALSDLDADAVRRATRLLGFVRELVGELSVLGADVNQERERVQAARKRLAADANSAAAVLFEVEALWPTLARKLEDNSPRKTPSLFDDWLKPG